MSQHIAEFTQKRSPPSARAIREDMPEMGVTVPAANFGAHHTVQGVRQVADRIIADRLVKLGQPPLECALLGVKTAVHHTPG